MELPGAIGVWRRMLETQADLVDALETRFRADHGLTATEFDVLVNIPSTTTIRHRELLDEIVLSRSALSRLLRRLETRGLVCQSADSADQRGVCVALTPEGLRLKRDSARTNADVVRAAFSALTEDNLGELLRLIDRIHPQPTEPIEQ
ncbi:MarR family winged helix-turn-helix transcriptional regulator [Brevibacterium sp. UCMA 11752]|uniref:MarR family winged helix-turn-helix transcriptional regulator n=1 Tax=Brevibacterium sp. UCMA 11752 TaxID=2745946 RepID=UPI001F2FDB3E|nr:MarR family winged helix-turn-helix transcriptional regulator [Brevibacterium sp. UCMA 11752]MCF2586135.1 winged helix-turn-helix transcriptional regulator [Brevibacterium sp. UCMA 11752]